MSDLMAADREAFIEKARQLYAVGSDDNIEIDDNAELNEGLYGTWVQAWVWVPHEVTDEELE